MYGDVVISLWVILESFQKKYGKDWSSRVPYKEWIGYLGVYRVIKPIKYTYITECNVTPGDLKKCSDKPCVHAQAVLHGNNFLLIQELGTELTMKPDDFPKHIELQEVMKVDLVQLACHQTDTMFAWPPTNAIFKK